MTEYDISHWIEFIFVITFVSAYKTSLGKMLFYEKTNEANQFNINNSLYQSTMKWNGSFKLQNS